MIRADRLQALDRRATRRFVATHPHSAGLTAAGAAHDLYGGPMHLMRDGPLPHPLFVERAQGAERHGGDGRRDTDFWLGDNGAMFGHSPPAPARALAAQAARGLSAMLPGAERPARSRARCRACSACRAGSSRCRPTRPWVPALRGWRPDRRRRSTPAACPEAPRDAAAADVDRVADRLAAFLDGLAGGCFSRIAIAIP